MANERNPGGDPTGLLQSLRAQDASSLLRHDVADRFVRDFVSKVFKAVADPVRLGAASVEAECGFSARVLSGTAVAAGYSIDPAWHPAGLAAFLRSAFPAQIRATESDEQAIASAFALMALAAYKILEEPAAEQEGHVDALVADGVAMLLGVRR